MNELFPEKSKQYENLKLKDIIKLSTSEDYNERRKAAELFAEQNFYKIEIFLNKLLNDENYYVRSEAIITAGKIKEPELFKSLTANLRLNEYHDVAFSAIINCGEKILPEPEQFFHKTEYFPEIQKSIIKLIKIIGGDKARKILQKKINYTDKNVANDVISALSALKYKAVRNDIPVLEMKLDEENEAYVYVCASIYDLREFSPEEDIIRALQHEKRNKREQIFTVLSLLYDTSAVELIKDNLESGNSEDSGFALEVADTIFSELHKKKLSAILENISEYEVVNKYHYIYPQEKLSVKDRLKDIINSEISVTGNYTKTLAINLLSQYDSEDVIQTFKANIIHSNGLIQETSAISLYFKDKELFEKQMALLKPVLKNPDFFYEKIKIQDKKSNLLILEKLRLLRSLNIFRDISFEKLSAYASGSEDFAVREGESFTVDCSQKDTVYLCVSGRFFNENTKEYVEAGEFIACFDETENKKSSFKAEEPGIIFKGQIYLLYNLFAENLQFAKRVSEETIHSF